MKISRLGKRIQQTLTNSKDIIQEGRKWPGQINARPSQWGLGTVQIKSIHGMLPVPFLGTDTVSLSCWKYICTRAIVHLSQSQSLERLTEERRFGFDSRLDTKGLKKLWAGLRLLRVFIKSTLCCSASPAFSFVLSYSLCTACKLLDLRVARMTTQTGCPVSSRRGKNSVPN